MNNNKINNHFKKIKILKYKKKKIKMVIINKDLIIEIKITKTISEVDQIFSKWINRCIINNNNSNNKWIMAIINSSHTAISRGLIKIMETGVVIINIPVKEICIKTIETIKKADIKKIRIINLILMLMMNLNSLLLAEIINNFNKISPTNNTMDRWIKDMTWTSIIDNNKIFLHYRNQINIHSRCRETKNNTNSESECVQNKEN